MKVLNVVSSLILIGISTFVFFSSLSLGIGQLRNPGPGFMPFLASILVLSLSLIILVMGLKGKNEGSSPIDRKKIFYPTILVMAILGYSFLLDVLGFLISIFLLMFVMFSMSQPTKWMKNIAISVVVIMVSYFIFKWLGVRFPGGILRI